MFAWALNRGLMFLKDFVVSFVWVIPVSPVGINVGDTRYTDLDYADDVVLFRNFIQELGSALQHFTQSPDTWDSAYCGRKQRYRTWVLETMLVMWLFAVRLFKACPSLSTSGPSSPPWANAQKRFSDELASLLRPWTRCKESGGIRGSPPRLNSACTESASCLSSCMAQSVGHCHGRTFGV